MTQAVCFKCGEIKWGAFGNCNSCGARPESDDDLMTSLAFTDHYFDQSKLQQIDGILKPETDRSFLMLKKNRCCPRSAK
jgi:hypothetical protein